MKQLYIITLLLIFTGCATQGYKTDFIISDPVEISEEKVNEVVSTNSP